MARKTLLAFAGLAVIAGVGATALAQDTPAATPLLADSNGDGYLDRSEAAAMPRLVERFDSLDRNRDGRLSQDERPARRHDGARRGHGGMKHGWMQRLDTNGDQRISQAEATAGSAGAGAGERFARMDINKDGFVDRADHQQRARQKSDEWFSSADTDRSGTLSRAEFDAAREKRMQGGRMGKGFAKPATP